MNIVLGLIKTFVFAGVLVFAAQAASKIDGVMFPVVGQTQLLTTGASAGVPTTATFSFYKKRQCGFEGVRWFFGSQDGASTSIGSRFVSTPMIRMIGEQKVTIEIDLSAFNISNNSYAVVTHDCYGGWLWKTETTFWHASPQPDRSITEH